MDYDDKKLYIYKNINSINNHNDIIEKLLVEKIIKVSISNSAYTTYEVIRNPYE